MRAGCLFSLLVSVAFCLPCDSADLIRVRPNAVDTLFANPGMGWQTFHRFADQDKALAGLPSGSAYFRFYWREIEPADGQIDFAIFDSLLNQAERTGQKLAFRIMCTGSAAYMDVPEWLKDQGCQGTEFTFEGKPHWVPDFTDSKFRKAHSRLIRELGKRYDGQPAMDLLDIGSVGLWGEWHMSGTQAVETGKPVPLPPVETRMAIIDEWAAAFPQSSRVVLIGSEEGMALAISRGLGWRADCLGDMGGFSRNWNHMEKFYLQQIEKTGTGEAWKKAPVAFESCWDMRKWTESGWDVRFIFDYALKLHASYINNKSAPLPEGARPEVERLLRRLGYRLVLQEVSFPATWTRKSQVAINSSWANVGVAPPYRDYRVAFALHPVAGGKPTVLTTPLSIRGWLPGAREEKVSAEVAAEVVPGKYVVKLGLVHPLSAKAEVRLAIDTPAEENWYRLGEIDLK